MDLGRGILDQLERNTHSPVLDFWRCVLWVSKPEWTAFFILSGGVRATNFVTAYKWSLWRLCFHRCPSVHRWVCLPLVVGRCGRQFPARIPWEQTPPQATTHPRQTPPWADSPRSRDPPCTVHAGIRSKTRQYAVVKIFFGSWEVNAANSHRNSAESASIWQKYKQTCRMLYCKESEKEPHFRSIFRQFKIEIFLNFCFLIKWIQRQQDSIPEGCVPSARQPYMFQRSPLDVRTVRR